MAKDLPIRRGAIPGGDPGRFDHRQIIAKINASSSADLQALQGAYQMLQRLIAQAESDLAFHRGRLKSAWPAGASSDAALANIGMLERDAAALSEASGKFATALAAAGRTVETYKATLPAETKGPLGGLLDGSPAEEVQLVKNAKDQQAREHMAEMNQGLVNAYSEIPASVSLSTVAGKPKAVPGEDSFSGGGIGVVAPRPSQPGSPDLNQPGSDPRPGRSPESPATPSPGIGPVPQNPGGGDPNGPDVTVPQPPNSSDLEGVQPPATPFVPGGSGPVPGLPAPGYVPGPPITGTPGPIPGVPGVMPPAPVPGPGGALPGQRPPGTFSRPGIPGAGGIRPGLGVPGVIGAPQGLSSRGSVPSGSRVNGLMGPKGVIGGSRTSAGMGPVPSGSAAGGRRSDQEQERETWLTEDEDVWHDGIQTTPPLID